MIEIPHSLLWTEMALRKSRKRKKKNFKTIYKTYIYFYQLQLSAFSDSLRHQMKAKLVEPVLVFHHIASHNNNKKNVA